MSSSTAVRGAAAQPGAMLRHPGGEQPQLVFTHIKDATFSSAPWRERVSDPDPVGCIGSALRRKDRGRGGSAAILLHSSLTAHACRDADGAPEWAADDSGSMKFQEGGSRIDDLKVSPKRGVLRKPPPADSLRVSATTLVQ